MLGGMRDLGELRKELQQSVGGLIKQLDEHKKTLDQNTRALEENTRSNILLTDALNKHTQALNQK